MFNSIPFPCKIRAATPSGHCAGLLKTPNLKPVQASSESSASVSTLEATQGQMDGSFSQLPYKCHLEEIASVRD